MYPDENERRTAVDFASRRTLQDLARVFSAYPPPIIETIDDDRLKVDRHFLVETLFLILAIAPAAFDIFIVAILIYTKFKPTVPHLVPAAMFLALCSAIGWLLWWDCTVFYIYDRRQGILFQYIRLFTFEYYRPLARREQVSLVTVNATYSGEIFTYSGLAVLTNGKKIRLTDWTTNFGQCSFIISSLAEFMEWNYIPGVPARHVYIKRGARMGEYRVEHVDTFRHVFFNPAHIIGISIFLVLLLGLLVMRCMK